MEPTTDISTHCFHCGEPTIGSPYLFDNKAFCCAGCKTVYQVLSKNGLCDYYTYAETPGVNQRVQVRKEKFAFLDDEKIKQQLLQFSDGKQSQVCFYLPQIHCSSCLWLLEHLQKIDPAVLQSRVDFGKKEVTILFAEKQASLRKMAELLTSVGYEPHISLHDLQAKPGRLYNRQRLLKLGVAGFCFSNIMLLSFPEYFGLEGLKEQFDLTHAFRYLNLVLSLPVLLYSASEFFASGWSGLRHRFLNIDAPIALAILITFLRSVYEITSDTGAGYLDSMSGIVFFMLVGRMLQDRTQQSLNFERDYTSYFPIAVSKLVNGAELPAALPDLRAGDSIIIHSQEIVPADGMMVRGKASIDYSFVTGESMPVTAGVSEMVYAGGRQTGGSIELLLVKDVSQSYLTSLWNKESMRSEDNNNDSWTHTVSKYFTIALFTITSIAGIYWYVNNPANLWPAVTAALIVACPCALLLSSTFTNGHIISILDKAKFYVRNASVIERICQVDHIVFDKTGTLTDGQEFEVDYKGPDLEPDDRTMIASLAAQSNHPLSKAIVKWIGERPFGVDNVKEHPGQGIEGWINDRYVKLGNPLFVWGHQANTGGGSIAGFKTDDGLEGFFVMKNSYRRGLESMLRKLQRRFTLSVLSGDNNHEEPALQKMMGTEAAMQFNCSPAQKLHYIEGLQSEKHCVMMVGDGLNDAGALKQSNVGIAVTDNINNFSPACDAIMEATQMSKLPAFIGMARAGKKIVIGSFVVSVMYNIVGLSFALQALLSPLVAAILMPASSITIVLLTWLSSLVAGKKWLSA